MKSLKFRFPAFASLLLGIVLILSGFFSLRMDMTTEEMKMANCTFMPSLASVCPMNASQHLDYWKQVFTAVPKLGESLLLVVTFFILGAAFPKLFSSFLRGIESTYRIFKPDKQRGYFSQLYDHLQQAFSSGVLKPKIF